MLLMNSKQTQSFMQTRHDVPHLLLSGPLSAGFQGLLVHRQPETADHARLAGLQPQPQVLNLSDVALTYGFILLSCVGVDDVRYGGYTR